MPFSPQRCLPYLTGGDFSDAYLEETSTLSLQWEDNRLDEVVQGRSAGVGLRCLRGEETLYGHVDCRGPLSRGLSSEERARLARLARDLFPAPSRRPKSFSGAVSRRSHGVSVPPEAVPLAEKVKLLERAERAARRLAGVRQVTVSYGERLKRTAYVDSRGTACEEERTYGVLSVEVAAGRGGLLQTGHESAGGLGGFELFSRDTPEALAETAARRAVAKLSAPPAPLGEMPVVISSAAGGTLIHEAIGHALEADGIQQGTSPHFAGKVGRAVANERVSVLDDPTLSGRRGSFFFDDEGTPSERTVLVDKGILKTYLYDRRTARRDRRASNGHGRRESYAHKPIPRMSNTFVAPGRDDPRAVVRSLKRGLLVTRMGGGQVNTATGDFVFEVEEGFWVESGKVKHMVRGASLLGNGAEVLRTIDRVGWDLGWSIGTCGKEGQGVPVSDGVPTLRIPKLVVGGVK